MYAKFEFKLARKILLHVISKKKHFIDRRKKGREKHNLLLYARTLVSNSFEDFNKHKTYNKSYRGFLKMFYFGLRRRILLVFADQTCKLIRFFCDCLLV